MASAGTQLALVMSMAHTLALADSIRCEVPVLFASSEGQTALIAIRLAAVLNHRGIDALAIDVSTPEAEAIDWTHVRGALVGASIHIGKHQKTAARFVQAHAADLNAVPSAFFSVSLSTASKNAAEVAAAARLAHEFPAAHGWRPTRILAVAGRLAYREYNVFMRFIMKRIATKEGGPTDTTRDHELTNWDDVDRLGSEMAAAIQARVAAA
jgi:menaquinone-dependent protoporphyrinogen oxidase